MKILKILTVLCSVLLVATFVYYKSIGWDKEQTSYSDVIPNELESVNLTNKDTTELPLKKDTKIHNLTKKANPRKPQGVNKYDSFIISNEGEQKKIQDIQDFEIAFSSKSAQPFDAEDVKNYVWNLPQIVPNDLDTNLTIKKDTLPKVDSTFDNAYKEYMYSSKSLQIMDKEEFKKIHEDLINRRDSIPANKDKSK